MSNRHADAIAIQLGACNPSAIAHSLVKAFQEIRDEPGFTGTEALKNDPAVKLMVHQLAFLTGVITGAEDFAKEPSYITCACACGDRIKVKG